jgi:hypothetical protein
MKTSSRWLLLSVVLIGTAACTGNEGAASDDLGAMPPNETSDEESSASAEPSAATENGPGGTDPGPSNSEEDTDEGIDPPSDEEPLAVPPLVIDGPEDDAGVTPGPSTTPEPEVGTSVGEPEPESTLVENSTTQPEPAVTEPEVTVPPEPAVIEPEVTVPPEPAVIEPEVTVPPEPAVIEPEPMVTSPEPEVVEPEPDPCAGVPQCDLVCAPGTWNPVDENGCVHSCECKADPNHDWCVDGCAADEQCVQEVPTRNGEETRYVCADLENDCDNAMACGCFEDYEDCTPSEETGLCSCPPRNPCGSCLVGQRCVYQKGGQSRYLCATELAACASPLACGCVVQQGACEMDEDRGVCSCDNGF